jgi:16S rRNA (guanine(1405)-N(7))-methyltransferase
MDEKQLLTKIKASKKYAMLCDDVVARHCAQAALAFKREKDAIKYVKAKLHAAHGLYIEEGVYEEADGLLDDYETADASGRFLLLERLLRLHASTRERLDNMREFYAFMRNHISGIRSILDLGCGFTPFSIPFMELNELESYYAYDIDAQMIRLADRFLQTTGLMFSAQVLDLALYPPHEQVDVALYLKLFPVLEAQKNGLGAQRLSQTACKYALVSFPTRTSSGRNRGMEGFYSAYYEEALLGVSDIVDKATIGSELIYIVKTHYS